MYPSDVKRRKTALAAIEALACDRRGEENEMPDKEEAIRMRLHFTGNELSRLKSIA
jgi:hypothetical protein